MCVLPAGKELEVMKEKGERAEELEIHMQKLERDNESLQKKVASLGITCEKVRCILFSALLLPACLPAVCLSVTPHMIQLNTFCLILSNKIWNNSDMAWFILIY